jgi:hypothetical protein
MRTPRASNVGYEALRTCKDFDEKFDELVEIFFLTRALLPAGNQTQETIQDEKEPELRDIKGSVKSTEGKITFVADEGGKSWDIVNPDALKDHVGHHVQLSAQVYVDKGEIHVMTVTML